MGSIASQESLDMDDGKPENFTMGTLRSEMPSTIKKNIKTMHKKKSNEPVNKIGCDTHDTSPSNKEMSPEYCLATEYPTDDNDSHSLKKNISTKGFKSKSSNNKENVNKFNPSDIASFQINQTENSKSSDS